MSDAGDYYIELFIASRNAQNYGPVRRSFLLSDMVDIAEVHPPHRDRLFDLMSESEAIIRAGGGPDWVTLDWKALVDALIDDPKLYRIRFFDSLEETNRSLLLQFVMFNELVEGGRWGEVEEVLLRKSRIAEVRYERIKSINAGHIETEKRVLHEFISEFASVEAGLKHLGYEKRADHITALLDTAAQTLLERERALSPRRISQKIKRRGSQEAFRQISGSRFEEFCVGVETGVQSWLDVAVALRANAEPEVKLALGRCIARALPSNAEAVIRSVELYADLSIGDVCGLPQVEQEATRIEEYKAAALTALGLIKQLDLIPLASECTKLLMTPK